VCRVDGKVAAVIVKLLAILKVHESPHEQDNK
jgi:hypothetical protein